MTMWCTIRTFAKHAVELGNEPVAAPIFFVKPSGCLHHEGPLPVSTHPAKFITRWNAWFSSTKRWNPWRSPLALI